MERIESETQEYPAKFNGKLQGGRLNNPDPITTSAPELVGSHPAMDLLNTIARIDGGLVDLWQSDDDVLRWLVRAGLVEAKTPVTGRRGALLATARRLREITRVLVVARKSARAVDTKPLNDFLAKGKSHGQLIRAKDGALSVMRLYERTNPEGLLAPLAEAGAEFLATADFDLVRRCEGEDCVLWFYDRTKSHRRRWCSMEVCGNRNKVTRFRSRQSG
jgi:predicted RNA-binding Zn ribbon-like protein